eukprot:UN03957
MIHFSIFAEHHGLYTICLKKILPRYYKTKHTHTKNSSFIFFHTYTLLCSNVNENIRLFCWRILPLPPLLLHHISLFLFLYIVFLIPPSLFLFFHHSHGDAIIYIYVFFFCNIILLIYYNPI